MVMGLAYTFWPPYGALGLPQYALGEMTRCTVLVRNTGVTRFKPKVLCQLMQERHLMHYNDCEVLWLTHPSFVEPGNQVTMVCQQRVCKAGVSCGGNAGAGPHWGRIALHAILEDGSEVVINDLANDTAGVPVAEVVTQAAVGDVTSQSWSKV
ncbi:MAG: hypothetical protein SVP26_03195 [Chloroflexota bacterium]|nr:hypothetical protein [Chloroflexota bacterium]